MSFVQKFLQFKQWQMRAQSHTAWILLTLSVTLNLATLLAVKNINTWYTILIFVGIVFVLTLIGYIDVTHGIFAKEASLVNKHNPEIQEILLILRRIESNGGLRK